MRVVLPTLACMGALAARTAWGRNLTLAKLAHLPFPATNLQSSRASPPTTLRLRCPYVPQACACMPSHRPWYPPPNLVLSTASESWVSVSDTSRA